MLRVCVRVASLEKRAMQEPAPISFHLDLYRYWLKKRGSGAMPSRSDIDPADIPALLPYVSLVHKVGGEFRFRLVGSDGSSDMI